MIEVTVADSGIGIKDEDKNKLFQLFGILDATKEINTKGIGLGLHICKLICEEFGGTCSFSSMYGLGSEFTFTFMLSKPDLNPLQVKIKRCKNPVVNFG